MARNVVLLGSTGSIGRQTLEVADEFADEVRIYALASHRSGELLAQQARRFKPRFSVLSEGSPDGLDFGASDLLMGYGSMAEICGHTEVDLVVVATSGSAGLLPTLTALRAGKLVALANKETLVMAGPVIQDELKLGRGRLVPIDSEHSALWQCLQGEPAEAIEKLVLTASGGALRALTLEQLRDVSPEQALRHPTWSMGRKVTIDSANLMNKGLETIEARWLFDVGMERIDVLLHSESIVHSLVHFADGSVKAQLGLPDMRLPIQYALSHPLRWQNSLSRLDLSKVGTLHFGPVDIDRYPALRLALESGRRGGTYPAVLCAADEVAVDAFLQGRIRFTDIPVIVEQTLDAHTHCGSPTLDDILASDDWARAFAAGLLSSQALIS